ncbi:GFA family protein [Microbulbifer taiwanensis]|uniref:GFA family protein n=1 Tax=Microbulbifer taiwanensis TaxID=986746 RepID=A0ABW1YM36_9GAMM|nr:GFA family protein [Microbulbifer taiwanensis]
MKGTCLCEAVTVEASESKEFEACHCGICRRWGGGPLLAVHCGNNAAFTGNESIATFASSDWAERGFCKNCGTHIFYHLKPTDEYIIPLGLFQSEGNFVFKGQVFIDQKPSFYEFSNQTENLTEREVFEKFGA